MLEKTLKSLSYSKEIKPVNPKGNQPWIFIGKRCWSSKILATWCEEPTHWKRPWFWERLRAGGEGATEDEMVGWPYQLNGHEFEQTLVDSGGERSQACCNPQSHKESDRIYWLNNNNKIQRFFLCVSDVSVKNLFSV